MMSDPADYPAWLRAQRLRIFTYDASRRKVHAQRKQSGAVTAPAIDGGKCECTRCPVCKQGYHDTGLHTVERVGQVEIDRFRCRCGHWWDRYK